MRQGGQGQMEGCRRCNGNRDRLWDGKGVAEDDGVGWTCWRSIGDRYLTLPKSNDYDYLMVIKD